MNPRTQTILIPIGAEPCGDRRLMEFHINAETRRACAFDEALFSSAGNVVFADIAAVHRFTKAYNARVDGKNHPERYLRAGQLNAMALIDEIFHYVCRLYRERMKADFFALARAHLDGAVGAEAVTRILSTFSERFPAKPVYAGKETAKAWLAGRDADGTAREFVALEELMTVELANQNPAFEPFLPMFDDTEIRGDAAWPRFWDAFRAWSSVNPPFGPEGRDLVSMLRAPVEYSPYDLKGQLEYIRTRWGSFLGEWLARLLGGLDLIAEEEKPGWGGGFGPGGPDMDAYEFGDINAEYERFSPDKDWMPNVVLMAKSVLVWLHQLSVSYGREISRLDQIPDEELDRLRDAGFTGLWLIGLWERSRASARIKQICGNPEAAASAYSLDDYEIASELGGWDALENLRARAWKRGIRMASDMVPNHTGMDSSWVVEKPHLFVQTAESPFPGYDFSGENLSHDGRVGIYLENHYYSKTDCAVVFKRVDNATGDARYIYHGNDGTGMPWNDTAQIDFLNPEAREEVIRKILHVAKNFPIIRFDAAMVLAKKHIQRLWYPEPGKGGDIASRSRFAISRAEFERRIPEEFWREVVDRCAKEIPDTLLLAEAFWMMEGYFVRTLGMHRVYNSAFMNMLKREDNEKYRTTIKNTIEFDPEILKRYVNFMNNPDEETAIAQFGSGDKYFGVCTMMVAMPGLPMFGHGQVEGFREKYGMEYRRAYRDEAPDAGLVERHRREIFPLMKKRWVFAGVENFYLYDFWEGSAVNENVFAWSNRAGSERALILYNNSFSRTAGWIKTSAAKAEKADDGERRLVQRALAHGLALTVRDGRFCVLRDQRTGLSFLRTTGELADKGLFATLDGFQTQAFSEIYEVDDGPEGLYRILYERLSGAGIRDVRMGIQNIVHADLYEALSALVTGEFVAKVREILESGPSRARSLARALSRSCRTRARAFYGACVATLLSEREASGLAVDYSGFDSARAVRAFAFRLAGLPASGLFGAVARRRAREVPAFAEAVAFSVAFDAIRDIPSRPFGAETHLGLIRLWTLDLKAVDMALDYGLGDRDLSERLSEFRTLLALREGRVRSGVGGAANAIRRLAAIHEIRASCGVHAWDGTIWFNKEGAESTAEFAAWAAVAFSRPVRAFPLLPLGTAARAVRRARVASALKKAKKLFTASAYRLEDLLASLPRK